MKKLSKFIIIFLLLFLYSDLHAQNSGEDLFKKYCSVCHRVNRGKLIGPDLANVQKRHTIDWIIQFVKSSQTMIKNGDKKAIGLFRENNNIIMPDHNLSEVQIKAIIEFITNSSIDNMSTGNPSTGISQWKSLSEAGGQNITAGEMLFEGNFTGANPVQNGGPTCNSCHTVKNKAVMSGGTLGPDLTKAYTKYHEAGLLAIINDPPFPVMKAAYLNRTLTKVEV
jgi:mono/diheme cytochrome c family protein